MVVCSLAEQREKRETKDLSIIVRNVLLEMGLQPRLSGFLYIQEAVSFAIEDFETAQRNIVHGVYPEVAERVYKRYGCNDIKNKVTCANVERGIRHAISSSWKYRQVSETMVNVFGRNRSEQNKAPSNKEYICGVAMYIMTVYD